MRDNVKTRLFEKGFSTKPKDEARHGIGFWGVKYFVERNGGRIGFQTELGTGTTFEFTIPYSHKEGSMCVQDVKWVR